MKQIDITDIEGIKVGHADNQQAKTGCTVVICEEGAAGGVDVRGGAPGTRETDLLDPTNLVDRIHAVLLSGGSAYGLDAAGGVMAYLEERDTGFDTGAAKVPIVPGAVIFDLAAGDPKIRPDWNMGYEASREAADFPPKQGNVGAGTGATVGKIMGMESVMPGGVGTYGVQAGDLQVAAIVVVNCFGDVIDPETNAIIAGARTGKEFIGTKEAMQSSIDAETNRFTGNTTIGVVATNARLTKAEAAKVASMAHNGFAQTISPAHTMVDGDTIFTMATDKVNADVSIVGALAADAVAQAVVNSVKRGQAL